MKFIALDVRSESAKGDSLLSGGDGRKFVTDISDLKSLPRALFAFPNIDQHIIERTNPVVHSARQYPQP